jgi:tRNA U55 pseudouridine synthase TruB
VSLKAVPVRVTRADLLDWSGRVARVVITCSAGFYVRSFARALGEAVGTGACLAELRRTRSGDFTLAQAVTIERLGATQEVAERWIGIDRLLPSLPAAALGEEGVRRITHGQEVLPVHRLTDRGPWPTPADTENDATRGWVRLTDPDGRLLALAKAGTTPNSLHPTVVLT